MPNHWKDEYDLVVEEKTLFRQVGWKGASGKFYELGDTLPGSRMQGEPSFCPIYEEITTWQEGEGWRD